MSSIAAILAIPSSGASQSVTGYPFGRGDGVNTVFAAPPEITAISALYRRDWQGNVTLSPSSRTNLCINSETLNSWNKITSGTGTAAVVTDAYALGPDGVTQNACRVVCNRGAGVSSSDYSAIDHTCAHTAGAAYVEGIWLKSNTGANQNVMIYWSLLTGSLISNVVVVTPAWQRFTATGNATSGSGGIQIGCRAANGDASLDFLATVAQVEAGSALGAYIPTVAAAVSVTDYSLAGLTATLAEAPPRAAEITVDGTGVGIPMLRIA